MRQKYYLLFFALKKNVINISSLHDTERIQFNQNAPYKFPNLKMQAQVSWTFSEFVFSYGPIPPKNPSIPAS
jgi:hypothetical protein